MFQIYFSVLENETDKSRFEAFYMKNRKLLHRIAMEVLHDNELAEDAVQEAFLRIARNFHKVENAESRKSRNFAVIITKRVALTMAEKESKRERGEVLAMEEKYLFTEMSREFDRFEYEELVDALNSLPEIYKSVLYMQGIYECTVKETASLLGISVEAAKKRTQRARQMLREILDKEVSCVERR